MPAIASIVIPAHDESALIGDCLDTLLKDATPDELEVVVVANGCNDDTAAVARQVNGVRVVEIPEASKVRALNTGDEIATAWPRIYVDADVMISTGAIRATVDALTKGGAMAAAPRLRVDTTGRPWLIRAYFQIYLQIPWTRHAMVGSGVYALSREAHRRLGAFPDVINDDLLVSRLFQTSERAAVANTTFTVPAPHDVISLIKTKTRVATGNLALRRDPPPSMDLVESKQALRDYVEIASRPAQWLALIAYCGIYLLTRVGARLRYRRGNIDNWARDRTTRERAPKAKNATSSKASQ